MARGGRARRRSPCPAGRGPLRADRPGLPLSCVERLQTLDLFRDLERHGQPDRSIARASIGAHERRRVVGAARGASRRPGAASAPTSGRIASADCALERWPSPPEIRCFSGQVYGPSRSMSSSWLNLDHQRRRFPQKLHEALLGAAEVEATTSTGALRLEGYATDSVRVVGRPEGPVAEAADPSVAAGLDAHERREEVAGETDRLGRPRRRVEGTVPARGEDRGPARVVVVLVGQEDGRDRVGAIPRRVMRRSISRAERPASTSTRVAPDSTTHALPPDPEARMVTRTRKMYQKNRTNYVRPVDPKPPPSREVGASFCATVSFARATGAKTSCAMRSPRESVAGSDPRFARMTLTSPR